MPRKRTTRAVASPQDAGRPADLRSSAGKSRSGEDRLETVSRRILKCTRSVLAELGPGRAAEEYEAALDKSMRTAELQFARQYPFGMDFLRPDETGFRADFVVDGWILLELKSAPAITAGHVDEAREYLRVSGCKLGLLINFGRRPPQIRRLEPESEPGT